MITGPIQDIIIHATLTVTTIIDMVIHTAMGLRIDTGIIMVGIIDTGIIMVGIMAVGIMAVNLWNLVLVKRTYSLMNGCYKGWKLMPIATFFQYDILFFLTAKILKDRYEIRSNNTQGKWLKVSGGANRLGDHSVRRKLLCWW